MGKNRDSAITDEPLRIRVIDVEPTTHPGLLQLFYDEVLGEAFGPNELGAPWWGVNVGTSAETMLALGSSDDVLGGIVSILFPRSCVRILSWLAVRSEFRGQGVGTLLMTHAAKSWYGQPGQQMVVGEIDDPRHWSGGAQDPILRLKFTII